MSQILPLENRVLVEPSKPPKAKGSILLPQAAQEKQHEGKVIAVGPGKTSDAGVLQPTGVNVGDRVFYSTYSGTECSLGDQQYLILSEDEILGILL